MSRIIHCNTYFEFELSGQSCFPLTSYLEKRPLILQLQFIPLIFASEDDTLLLSHKPPEGYLRNLQDLFPKPLPKTCTLDNIPKVNELQTWGYSKEWANWAKKNQISYTAPPWEAVVAVNRKDFCHKNTSTIPGSQLIFSDIELKQWTKKHQAPFVLKTLYGVASTGNLKSQNSSPFLSKKQIHTINQEWEKGHALIAEKWVQRKEDFSSHWNISPTQEVSYVGLSKTQNTHSGSFLSSLCTSNETLLNIPMTFLLTHKKEAQALLKKIAQTGYHGPVGLDAMIYMHPLTNQKQHTIIEINARQTMALACILCLKRHYPNKTLLLKYTREEKIQSLIPKEVTIKAGKILKLPKRISLKVIKPVIMT